MGIEKSYDRRTFIHCSGVAAFSLLGIQHSRQQGPNGGDEQEGPAGGDEQEGPTGGDEEQIEYLRMVLPEIEFLEPDIANRIVVVGSPNMPGFRPPDVCFPEVPETVEDGQWHSYEAVAVDPTESEGIFEDDPNDVGEIEQTTAFVSRLVRPRTVYRLTGGEACADDEYIQVVGHELPPGLSEFFDLEDLEFIVGLLED